MTHPSVADAAVIGIPDDEAGELPKAFVALKAGEKVSAEGIQQFVADQVATYKQIRILEFVDEIPKSASGKILRRMLRDQVSRCGRNRVSHSVRVTVGLCLKRLLV